ncbi:MAG TPA: DUF2461 domain-containing protein [Nitriliruptorales bacterium]
MSFDGFPPATVRFLAGISSHNDRDWFDSHRDLYEQAWLEPAKDFVVASGDALADIAPMVVADPRVNGSIFRINRDTRFSPDKRPYKDHLDLWFWEGERKDAISGWFARITAKQVVIGVGSHGFDRKQLATYRERVADPRDGARLLDGVRTVRRAGFPVKGEHYRRTPKGYDELEGERERLIRHNALYASVELAHPKSLSSSRFVDFCMTRWRKMTPLHRWLVDRPA